MVMEGNTIKALFPGCCVGERKKSGTHRVHNGNWKAADTMPCSSS